MENIKNQKLLLVCFVIFVALLPTLLRAQGSTGKIAGIVIDGQNNEALPGANVSIEGTNRGSASDAEGRYIILAVPPGMYNLKVTFVGYSSVVKQEVRVSIGRTTTSDFELKPAAIRGEVIVVTAERERVRMDVSYSETSIGEAELRLSPVGTQLKEILRTKPGVELDGIGRISIRGSKYDEVGFVVDGVSQNMARFSTAAFTNVPKAAIEEIQVLTGGFNAEYGEARSGLINIVTKEGGERLHGTLNFRYRPSGLKHRGFNIYSSENYWDVGRFLSMEPTGDRNEDGKPDFVGWNEAFAGGKLRTPVYQVGASFQGAEEGKPASAEEALEIWKYHHRPWDYGDEPDYYVEATLSGTVPNMPLRFFISSFYNREMFVFPTIRPDYVEHLTSLKLNWDATPNLKIQFLASYGETNTANNHRVQGDIEYNKLNGQGKFMNNYWDSALKHGFWQLRKNGFYNQHSWSRLETIKRPSFGTRITWVKSPKTFVELQINQSYNNFSTPYERTRDEDTVAQTVGDIRLTETPKGFVSWGAPFDMLRLFTLGRGWGYDDDSKVAVTRARLDWTSQVAIRHQIKAGINFNHYNLDMEYGRSQDIDPEASSYHRWWTERRVKENEWSAYVQDKIEFKGLIMNVGVRVDGFSPLTDHFLNDYDPNFNAEFNFPAEALYTEVPSEDRGILVKPETKWAVSPRVGVSHPIGENSKLYFNYGYFYQRPAIHNQYADITNSLGAIHVTGNPYLDFTKSINYELGMEQSFGSMFLFRLAGYYKDVARGWDRARFQSSRADKTISYESYLNNVYADIRGVEATLEIVGRYIDARFNYDYLVVSNGMAGQKVYFEDPNEIIFKTDLFNPVAEAPRSRPRFNATLSLFSPRYTAKSWLKPFTDMSLTLFFRWRAGQHFNFHETPLYPGTDERDPNNVQWKADRRTDLRVEKAIKVVGAFNIRPYLQITNLFDYKYYYLPEQAGGGFNFNTPWTNSWTNYMDWVSINDKTPGDWEGLSGKNLPSREYLLWNQPRDFRFGIQFEF